MSFHCTATPRLLSSTLTPFLYPCLDLQWTQALRCGARRSRRFLGRRALATEAIEPKSIDVSQHNHLNPEPTDYSAAPFTDACTLTVSAGAGGHGCISFLREKYIDNGPPNGGDGGTGGSVWIQAVQGETSLHKLARRGVVKAGRGKNGQGSMQGGSRGEDVLITVPVGTVLREISRVDPQEQEEQKLTKASKGYGRNVDHSEHGEDHAPAFQREKWLLYPGTMPKSFSVAEIPPVPRSRRNPLSSLQPPMPLRLDLDKPMQKPLLLAAGALGGMGNPHFVSKTSPKPKFALKGDNPMRIHMQLELKILADVGLVGLPNAGKSTLLRALTKSRTRVGNWAFTTLSPNLGTVVLDSYAGRPALDTKGRQKEPRTNITIADIPGLIEDAHLDRGLGLGFLRHIERAAVLAFVVDLSARDAVDAVKGLWREVGEYEQLRERELSADTQRVNPQEDGISAFKPFENSTEPDITEEPAHALLNPPSGRALPPLSLPPISSKPWLVIATKADLPETQDNFLRLRQYLESVENGREEHPSGKKNGWRKKLYSVPVSAINKQGVTTLPEIILRLLDD